MSQKKKRPIKKSQNNKILEFIKNNKIFLILFLISTTYFAYENITTASWDLSVFVLNAQSIFSDSTYLEVGRPPMASIILGILGLIVGWKLAEIFFVILTSSLFAYAIHQLSKTLNFKPEVMYALALNAYVFIYGLSVGTEILSLSFLILAITLIIKNNTLSGLFIALAGLTRYNALVLFPLTIFHLQTKKIITALIIFGVTITAWLTHNFLIYGNMFESIANQYALNVINRADFEQPVNIFHFIKAMNILIPFFLYGLIIKLKELIKDANKKTKNDNKIKNYLKQKKPELIMLVILIYTIIDYATTPLKIPRYLFFIVLPTIYFAYIGIKQLITKLKKKENLMIKIALIIFTMSLTYLILFPPYYDRPEPYERSAQKLSELNISNCQIQSNVWPHMNYLGIYAEPAPRKEFIEENIEQGKIIHLLKSAGEPEYVQDKEFINTLPIIYEDNNLYILGQKDCEEGKPVIHSYLQEFNESIAKRFEYESNINPCFVIFMKYAPLEKACNLIHGKGFSLDNNREFW